MMSMTALILAGISAITALALIIIWRTGLISRGIDRFAAALERLSDNDWEDRC